MPNESAHMPPQESAFSVGIVTRTKNRAVLLRRALESVKSQTFPFWSLVIVNDGGAPEPVDSLVEAIFGAGDPRVRVIHHSHSMGMEAASNAGLRTLDTRYAIIHDDDDSWAPEFLSVMTQVVEQQRAAFPSIRGCVSKINVVYETVTANHIEINQVEPWKAGPVDCLAEGFLSVQDMLLRNQFPPIAFLFDLAACRDLGGFDETLPVLGDWDFHGRFVMDHDVWIHPEYLAFYHHRKTATGALGNTVLAGVKTHQIYATVLRNRWLRSALRADPSTRILLPAIMEIQDRHTQALGGGQLLQGDLADQIAAAIRQARKSGRSGLRKALSRWMRALKSRLRGDRQG